MQVRTFHQTIGDWQAALPHPRMRVYRNNVVGGLVSALQVRFPVVCELVGLDFFRALAAGFAESDRPSSPVLISYGEEFPDFIRGFGPAQPLPYLADVGSLENLWWRAYHGREAASITASALASIPPEQAGEVRFGFHPSFGLLSSGYAIGAIWLAHRGGPPMSAIDLGEAQSVLVVRPEEQVVVHVIAHQTHAFLAALAESETLADAVERASAIDPDFDIAGQIAAAFALGLITEIHT